MASIITKFMHDLLQINATNEESSYHKIYSATDNYIQIYERDHLALFDLINNNYYEYQRNVGIIRDNLLSQIDLATKDLQTMHFLVFQNSNDSQLSPHLMPSLRNIRTLSDVYWNTTVKFNTTYLDNTPSNMFIEDSLEDCNEKKILFHDNIEDLFIYLETETFNGDFFLKVTSFTDSVKHYSECSAEYINKLTTLKARLDLISPAILGSLLSEVEDLLRDLNIHELHLPLLQV